MATSENTLQNGYLSTNELQLLECAQNGVVERDRQQAFTELADLPFRDRLINFCLREGHNRQDAEDFAQQTLVRAYRGIEGFKAECSLWTWLQRILMNVIKDRARYNTTRQNIKAESLDGIMWPGEGEASCTFDVPDSTPSAQDRLENDVILQTFLDSLSETHQLVWLLYHQQRTSVKRINEVTKINIPLIYFWCRLEEIMHGNVRKGLAAVKALFEGQANLKPPEPSVRKPKSSQKDVRHEK